MADNIIDKILGSFGGQTEQDTDTKDSRTYNLLEVSQLLDEPMSKVLETLKAVECQRCYEQDAEIPLCDVLAAAQRLGCMYDCVCRLLDGHETQQDTSTQTTLKDTSPFPRGTRIPTYVVDYTDLGKYKMGTCTHVRLGRMPHNGEEQERYVGCSLCNTLPKVDEIACLVCTDYKESTEVKRRNLKIIENVCRFTCK